MDRQRPRALIATIALLLALAGAAGPPAAGGTAATTYIVTEIGTLGGAASFAEDLNDAGQVVGTADTAAGQPRAFLWAGGVLTDLGTLPGGEASSAAGIDARGQVVGVATTAPGQQLRGPGSRAVLWQGGRPIDLGTLGGDVSEATAVNDAGQVVGVAAIPPDQRAGGVGNRAVLWANGQITDLGTLPGGDNNRANDVNSRGEAVGIWLPGAPLTPFHAALWAGGRLVDLGTLPGAPVSRALAINDAGQIAGRAADAPEGGRPPDCPAPRRCVPILHRGGAWVELPTLPGFPNGSTTELNNAGQVVGQVQAADGASRAVLWAGDAVIDLNTAIPAGSGWVLTTAFDINERGQIVGAGTLHGQRRGFLLSPAATPGLPDTGAGGAPVRSPMTGALLALGASLVLLGAGVAAAVRRRGRATVA